MPSPAGSQPDVYVTPVPTSRRRDRLATTPANMTCANVGPRGREWSGRDPWGPHLPDRGQAATPRMSPRAQRRDDQTQPAAWGRVGGDGGLFPTHGLTRARRGYSGGAHDQDSLSPPPVAAERLIIVEKIASGPVPTKRRLWGSDPRNLKDCWHVSIAWRNRTAGPETSSRWPLPRWRGPSSS
jgi:hypothetical protein